jgi:hypothetical protein
LAYNQRLTSLSSISGLALLCVSIKDFASLINNQYHNDSALLEIPKVLSQICFPFEEIIGHPEFPGAMVASVLIYVNPLYLIVHATVPFVVVNVSHQIPGYQIACTLSESFGI